jgi:hypothetical protein
MSGRHRENKFTRLDVLCYRNNIALCPNHKTITVQTTRPLQQPSPVHAHGYRWNSKRAQPIYGVRVGDLRRSLFAMAVTVRQPYSPFCLQSLLRSGILYASANTHRPHRYVMGPTGHCLLSETTFVPGHGHRAR